jgi:uncharacterized protein (TIGR02147 family)
MSDSKEGEVPEINHFIDYRAFLKSWIEHKRRCSKNFSLRGLNMKCGFSSPSYIQAIVKGKRSLTLKALPQFSSALKLKQKESEYLKALIKYNHAGHPDDKNKYFQKILELRSMSTTKDLTSLEEVFLSQWYNITVYTLIKGPGNFNSAKDIQKRIYPTITTADVNKALKILQKLGFVTRDEAGTYHAEDLNLKADKGISIEVINMYHQQILDLSYNALKTADISDREFNGVSIRVSKAKLREARDYLKRFRSKFRVKFDDPEGEEVFHLETILFPMTKPSKEGGTDA